MLTTVPCGAIVQQDVVLQADIGPCPGYGMLVQSAPANNVTIDLNGHRIIGIPGSPPGLDGQWAGIRLGSVAGVTVKNGTITGFGYGVMLSAAHRTTVTNMTLVDNIGSRTPQGAISGGGIQLNGSHDNVLRGNRILHNGPGSGIALLTSAGNLVEGNVIQDNNLRNDGGNGHFPGLLIQQTSGVLVQGGELPPRDPSDRRGDNVVRNNRIAGNGWHGVSLTGLTNNDTVAGNTITGNGLDQPAEPRLIPYGDGIFVGNVQGLLVEGNTITGNGGNGIAVIGAGNTFRRNLAVSNVRAPNPFPTYDINDSRFNCAGNTWSQNYAITSNQPCVLA